MCMCVFFVIPYYVCLYVYVCVCACACLCEYVFLCRFPCVCVFFLRSYQSICMCMYVFVSKAYPAMLAIAFSAVP